MSPRQFQAREANPVPAAPRGGGGIQDQQDGRLCRQGILLKSLLDQI